MAGNLVLLSGGLDSALVWLMAKENGEKTHALWFDYGQAQAKEEFSAMKLFADRVGAEFSIGKIQALAKSDDVVFVGRNLLFIAHAIPVAAQIGADKIWIGCNWTDRERFPDCRIEFLRAADECAMAYGINLMRPLIGSTKQEIMGILRALGFDWDDFWSCYAPKSGKPCGECLACKVRG